MMRCPMPACGSEEWHRLSRYYRDDDGKWTEVKEPEGEEMVRCARCFAPFIVLDQPDGTTALVRRDG